MATVAEVYDGTLELLGILPLGGTIKAVDSARMARAYNQVFEDLKIDSLTTWAVADDVPDEAVPHMEALMAYNAMDTYYVNDRRAARIMSKHAIAKRELARLSVADYESTDEPVDY